MIKFEIGWKCGKCGKIHKDILNLKKEKAVDSDTDPMNQHGYISVCDCGYRFFKDKWTHHTIVDKDSFKVDVSTIDLELNHFGYWYETMLFIRDSKYQKDLDASYTKRYKTKEEAMIDHLRVVKLLEKDKYTIEPVRYELRLSE